MPVNETSAPASGATATASASILFLFAETPVHAGAAEGKAALDLPIQRSVQTRWPILNDSSLRGGLRAHVEAATTPQPEKPQPGKRTPADELFGDVNTPGKLVTPDAEVLLFPVASARGLTAWVTCVTALQHFLRRAKMFRGTLSESARKAIEGLEESVDACIAEADSTENWAVAPDPCDLEWVGEDQPQAGAPAQARRIILESDSFDCDTDPNRRRAAGEVASWMALHAVPLNQFWKDRLKSHMVIVSEEAFTHYVTTKTDIRTRVKLEGGTVAQGPWTEENLPVDTLLYSIVSAGSHGAQAVHGFRKGIGLVKSNGDKDNPGRPVVQLGGDQSLGRGMVRLTELV